MSITSFLLLFRTIKLEIEKEKRLQELLLKESKLNYFDFKNGSKKTGMNKR